MMAAPDESLTRDRRPAIAFIPRSAHLGIDALLPPSGR